MTLANDIMEKNIIIAKYMGGELGTKYLSAEMSYLKWWTFPAETKPPFHQKGCETQYLLYNKEWSWLIPVWAKFLKDCQEIIRGNAMLQQQYDDRWKQFHLLVAANDIENAFLVLYSYIDWLDEVKSWNK